MLQVLESLPDLETRSSIRANGWPSTPATNTESEVLPVKGAFPSAFKNTNRYKSYRITRREIILSLRNDLKRIHVLSSLTFPVAKFHPHPPSVLSPGGEGSPPCAEILRATVSAGRWTIFPTRPTRGAFEAGCGAGQRCSPCAGHPACPGGGRARQSLCRYALCLCAGRLVAEPVKAVARSFLSTSGGGLRARPVPGGDVATQRCVCAVRPGGPVASLQIALLFRSASSRRCGTLWKSDS